MYHDVACVGLMVLDIAGRPVETLPPVGGVTFIDEIRMTVAGTAGGTTVNCAKLGLTTLAVGCVGFDEKGEFLLDVYRRQGVDISGMRRTDQAETSARILAVRPDGEQAALHLRGASDYFSLDADDYDLICDGPYLHFGGTGLLNAMDGAPTAALLAAAKERSLTVTFDMVEPNDRSLALLEPALPHIDYFMPTIEEAAMLSGQSEAADIGQFFLDRGVGTCIFKAGADGSYLIDRRGLTKIPAHAIEVLDTAGCGEAYCAGFIAGLHEGWTVEGACQLATAVSAQVAMHLGADAGIADLASTVAFMDQTPLR